MPDSAPVGRRVIITIAAAFLAVIAASIATKAGDDDKVKSYGTFTECSSFGTPVVTDDPRGDQRTTKGDKVESSPQGDLVRLRLAKSPKGDRLCAEFQAAGQVKPYVAYVLTMRPQDAETPYLQLETTVLGGEAPKAMLDVSGTGKDFRTIPATVGIKGDKLSIVVTKAPFTAEKQDATFASFRFQARSAVAAKDEARLTDCLPVCQ
jgi:hypothetical protein